MSLNRSVIEVYATKNGDVDVDVSEDNPGITLRNGSISSTYYYDQIIEDNFEYDYEDISSNGSVSFTEVNKNIFQIGKKACLKKGGSNELEDFKTALLGFIIEQKYSQNTVDIKMAGMTKLLDQEKKYSFKKTKRSQIIKSIIESCGLKCNINTKGLKDDVIDYTNISSESSNSSSSSSANIAGIVQEVTDGLSDDLEKAKALHEWGRKNITYKRYECSKRDDADECLSHKDCLNCADTARLMCALFKGANLDAEVVHGPNHFWTIVTIKGKEYASDPTSKSRKWNQVWKNLNYYKKCGDKPDC